MVRAISDNNDSIKNATQLGILPNGLTNLPSVSIDSPADQDFFTFETSGHSAVIRIAVRPNGSTYLEGPQTPACDTGFPFNSLAVRNLDFELLDASGAVLDVQDVADFGEPEEVVDFQLPVSTGPFTIHVIGGGATNRSQLYFVEIDITGGIQPPEMTTTDATANEGDWVREFDLQLSEA